MFVRMLKSAGEHSAADLLPEIDVPALVVAGEKDTFTPPQLAASMAGDLPRGRLLLVPGGTHVAPLEQHQLVGEGDPALLDGHRRGVAKVRVRARFAFALFAFVLCAVPSAPAPLRAGGAEPVRMHLANLVWDRRSIASFDGVLVGEDPRRVRVRLATLADPMRYKAELAFYKLATALGSDLVPRTRVSAMPLGELLGALATDPAGAVIVRRDVAILNDATVVATIVDAVAHTEDVVPTAGVWSEPLRAWVEARAPVPDEGRVLASAYVEELILDYLAGNVSRSMAAYDPAARTLRLLDNRGAFLDHPEAKSLDIGLNHLKRVVRFPKRLVAKLRAFEPAAATALLRPGAFADWLLAPRSVAEMMERRHAILSLVDSRVAQSGEGAALALP